MSLSIKKNNEELMVFTISSILSSNTVKNIIHYLYNKNVNFLLKDIKGLYVYR